MELRLASKCFCGGTAFHCGGQAFRFLAEAETGQSFITGFKGVVCIGIFILLCLAAGIWWLRR